MKLITSILLTFALLTSCKKNEVNPSEPNYTVDDCVDPSIIDSTNFITTIYKPVCGCDGKTYSNSGEAYYRAGISKYTQGECK